MGIGNLIASSAWSSKVFTGSVIADRFTATTSNQQTVLFLDKDGKQSHLNSFMIEADASDLYFTPIRNIGNPSTFNYVGEPVFVCKSGETLSVGGFECIGVKFSNASGARYFIQGTRY